MIYKKCKNKLTFYKIVKSNPISNNVSIGTSYVITNV
jgi:hypothetical protein